MNYLIILFLLLILTACNCDEYTYKCTSEQLDLVKKEVEACAAKDYSSYRRTCFKNAKKSQCTKIKRKRK